MWRCSFGVVNCPICMPPLTAEQKLKLAADARSKKIIKMVSDAIAKGRAKAKMKNGKVAFEGLTSDERDGATDECLFAAIMSKGSQAAKMKLAQFAPAATTRGFVCN